MDDLSVWPPPPTAPASKPSDSFSLIRGRGYVITQGVNMVVNVAYSFTLLWLGQSRTDEAALAHGVAYLIHSLLLIVTAIFFLVYVYQSAKSVRAFGTRRSSPEPEWTVAWFFVPVLNLFMPWRMMQSLWKESLAGHEPDQEPETQTNGNSSLVSAWWLTFLYYVVSVLVVNVLAYRERHVSELLYRWGAGNALGSLIAALLSIKLVQAISRRQEQSAKILGLDMK